MLPDFIIPELVKKEFKTTGIDSLEHCFNKNYFKNYPYYIDYKYNKQGYRDYEWPDDPNNCVWCIGDSFTVGLGLPFDYTWSQQFQKLIDYPVITMAMDGASNQWIAKKMKQVYNHMNPKLVVVMWSYFHRRENPDKTLSDMERRIHGNPDSVLEDFDLFENLINKFDNDKLINLLVPNYHSIVDIEKIWQDVKDQSWPDNISSSLNDLPNYIKKELYEYHNVGDTLELLLQLRERLQIIKSKFTFVDYVVEDYARDYHHFGVQTSRSIAGKLFDVVAK